MSENQILIHLVSYRKYQKKKFIRDTVCLPQKYNKQKEI